MLFKAQFLSLLRLRVPFPTRDSLPLLRTCCLLDRVYGLLTRQLVVVDLLPQRSDKAVLDRVSRPAKSAALPSILAVNRLRCLSHLLPPTDW